MSRTVLITGATGLLGREVVHSFERDDWHVVGTGFSRANPPSTLKVDLCNEGQVNDTLDKVKPQVVIHCAAQRFPDKVDADPEAARSLNISATQSLAHATSSRSILLIYISTDYVFPGTAGDAPYESHASPAPPNLYGQTKLDGEKAVLAATKDSSLGVVLRVPVLYGPATKPAESAVNVLMDSLWKAQEPGAKIAMDDWSIRYPTCTEDVGRVCSDIAAMYLEAKAKSTAALTELPHILQFSSEDRVSKYEICEIFAEIMCLPMTGLVANKQGNDPNAKVQRPYDCHLSTNDLKTLGIDIRTVNFRDWWRREVKAYKR